eukprot:Rmarinus@m.11606
MLLVRRLAYLSLSGWLVRRDYRTCVTCATTKAGPCSTTCLRCACPPQGDMVVLVLLWFATYWSMLGYSTFATSQTTRGLPYSTLQWREVTFQSLRIFLRTAA